MWHPFKKNEERSNKTLEQLLETYSNTYSGVTVNATTAEKLATVSACISLISGTIASMPIYSFNVSDKGTERQKNHQIDSLLNRHATSSITAYDLKYHLVSQAILRGDGFIQIVFDNRGTVSQLIPHESDNVQVKILPNSRLGYVASRLGKEVALSEDEVIHVRLNSLDNINGRSIIAVCRDVVGEGLSQDITASSQAKNAFRPSMVLETDNVFKDIGAATRLRKDFSDKYQGQVNTGSVPLLENGLKLNSVNVSNLDSQFIEQRNFSVQQLCALFTVPKALITGESGDYDQLQRQFLNNCIKPLISNIELAMSAKLIPQRNKNIIQLQFDTSSVYRASPEQRMKNYDLGTRAGIYTINECRAKEGLSPVTGGDEVLTPSWLNQVEAVKENNK